MSWHCLFCNYPECWVRGREKEKDYGMIEIFVSDGLGGKKISLGVCHADCFKKALKYGQKKYMKYGEEDNFEELDKFMNIEDEKK